MRFSSIGKIHRANLFYVFLKQQSKDYLDTQDISKCEDCGGLGLENIQTSEKSTSWDGVSYCSTCEGVGYIGVKGGMQIDFLHYICKRCGGLGCDSCNNGIVDWIDHSMGR